MTPTVVCLGETMAQLVPTDEAGVADAAVFAVGTAGAESNVACGLAQLGVTAAWASRLGDDPLGTRVRRDVAGRGVDVSLVVTVPGSQTGLYVKDAAAGGSAVYYYRRDSAAAGMNRSDVDRVLAAKPTVLHLTGITPALSPSCRDAVEHALQTASRSGVTVSFDVNHRPGLWPAAEAADVLRGLAARADVVFVGLDEAARLWGVRAAENVRAVLPEPPTVVVKDGDREAVCLCADGPHRQPAPAVEVVEPVGAGDAFAAGWLAGLVHDLPHDARLRLGHLVAGEVLRSVFDVVELSDPVGVIERARRGTG